MHMKESTKQDARCKNTREWRAVYPIIRQERLFDSYSQLWIREKRKLKDELAIKRKRKVAFLTEKYSKKRVTPDVVEGIFVGDQELDGGFTSEPRWYGACEVSGNEKQALSLPPKFAVYTKVNSVSVEAEIEKGLAKYRWEQIERKEPVEEAGVVYDTATKKVDMRNFRATDFPFNKRVILPSALSEQKEVGLQHLKNNMLKSVNNYVWNDMNKRWQNLTVNEKNGLRSLRERSKDNSVVIYQADKSGRSSIDTAENYILACDPHVKGDETITQQDYERLESEMNAHSVIWTRILKAGHRTGHVNRIKNNMITQDCPIAPLYTLRKDHKNIDDKVKGPLYDLFVERCRRIISGCLM